MSEGRTPERERDEDASAEQRIEHLYVHVPFCCSRCAYCDFHTLTIDDRAADPRVQRFCERAVEVVVEQAERGVVGDVETVYFGGGTPSALAGALGPLVERIVSAVRARPGAEITVEANPDTSDVASFEAMRRGGVTRVSVGAQSFDDEVLETLGRRHDADAALRALDDARRVGFDVSADLMCGVPGQTMASWERTLETALEEGLEHVSVYPLGLEEGTPLARAVREGRARGPDEDIAASMLELAEHVLEAADLARYEISNYAVPGRESRHNTSYWVGAPYVGVGPSAASMCGPSVAGRTGAGLSCESGTERVRFVVGEGLEAFDEGALGRLREVECMTGREADVEDVVLGLRLAAGVTARRADAAGVLGALEEMEDRGLLVRSSEGFRLHGRGWLLANEVFGAVWALR